MPKILITGASGFVGSHVLETLINIQHPDIEIVAACRDPQRLLPEFKGEVRVGDLRDMAYLDRLLAGIDIVCHCAGWTSFLNHEKNMGELYLEPTLELINRIFEWRIQRFVNLSSLAVTGFRTQGDDVAGTPLRGCPMINGLIAVENYLQAQSVNYATSIINLRAGIYAGKRMGRGLLMTLLNPSRKIMVPYAAGNNSFMPIVDGRDIGQAFARACLAPANTSYTSVNITGPEVPAQKDVIGFLQTQEDSHYYLPLPTSLYRLLVKTLAVWPSLRLGYLTRCQLTMLSSPAVNAYTACELLGYAPEISWKASLLSTLAAAQKSADKVGLHDPIKPNDML